MVLRTMPIPNSGNSLEDFRKTKGTENCKL